MHGKRIPEGHLCFGSIKKRFRENKGITPLGRESPTQKNKWALQHIKKKKNNISNNQMQEFKYIHTNLFIVRKAKL